MEWLRWNMRGINKRYKQKKLTQYLKEQRIKLAGLVETRVKHHKVEKIIKKSSAWVEV